MNKVVAKDSDSDSENGVPKSTPSRLVDLTAFHIAFFLYVEEVGRKDEHAKRGAALSMRYSDGMVACLEKYIYPLVEAREITRIKTKYNKSKRGRGASRALSIGDFLGTALQRMKKRMEHFNSVFQGKNRPAALDIHAALEEESTAAALHILAGIPSKSGLQSPRKWIKKAAILLGAGLSELDDTISDTKSVVVLAEKIKELQKKIRSTDSMDPQAADWQAQVQKLKDRLEEVAADSNNPDAVMSAALAELGKIEDTTSAVGARLSLSEEQMKAMMADGKVIIGAGAGSGKSRVVAGKVAYAVEEQGYSPEQVLATSFTRKASKELAERCQDYTTVPLPSRQQGGYIGRTTHSIAVSILQKFAPSSVKKGLFKASDDLVQDLLVEIAIEQANMGEEGDILSRMQEYLLQARQEILESGRGDSLYWLLQDRDTGRTEKRGRMQGILGGTLESMKKGRLPSAGQMRYLKRVFDAFGTFNGQFDPEEVEQFPLQIRGKKGDSEWFEKKKKKEHKELLNALRSSKWRTQPAKEWFNLGSEDGGLFSVNQARTFITKHKGNIKNPKDLYDAVLDSGDMKMIEGAAIWGAYEWLKGNDSAMLAATGGPPALDLSDMIWAVGDVMQSSKKARKSLQSQFKVILVDEAQDLNQAQHRMFEYLAGARNPDTDEPWKDGEPGKPEGGMTADTYALVGDDKQCVEINTMISTPTGLVRAKDITKGDKVLSYLNGDIVPQKVNHVMKSSWDWGYQVETSSGKTLTMSPNHKIWASDIITEEEDMVVYLMYRKDMGFRVGVTNKGKDLEYHNHFGGRAFLEKAERLWILDVCPNREEALLKEIEYSLEYGIPTSVFNGGHRGLNQDRLDSIFEKFGSNGGQLLEDKHLSFDLPNWMSCSYSKHGRKRRTLNMVAHSSNNNQVAMEWKGTDLDVVLDDISYSKNKDNYNRLRKYFASYREALAFAQDIQRRTGANMKRKLSTPEGCLKLITASCLYPNMKVAVEHNGNITQEVVVSVEKVQGEFIDLDVGDASNFFGGGILSHNSIYAFRSAEVGEFIDRSDTYGGDFETNLLTTNYRSGANIIHAANQLIKHNEKQIPMTCLPYEKKGEGSIEHVHMETHAQIANLAAEEVAYQVGNEDIDATLDDFGVAVRNNSEADAFEVEFVRRGLLYRRKGSFFSKKTVRAIMSWVKFATSSSVNERNQWFLEATMAPVSFLGYAFKRDCKKKIPEGEDYFEWLMDNKLYRGSKKWRNDAVENHVKNAMIAKTVAEKEDGPKLIQTIIELEGKKGDTILKMAQDNEAKVTTAAGANEDLPEDMQEEEEDTVGTSSEIEVLMGMFSSMENFVEAIEYYDTLVETSEKASKGELDDSEPAIDLLTVHGWKGLEKKHMFVCMNSGVFPPDPYMYKDMQGNPMPDHPLSESAEEYEERLEEERRLGYVAITRGMDSVTVLSSSENYKGLPSGPSQFISEACIKEAEGAITASSDLEERWEYLPEDLYAI